jgi:RNA polymerase sigma factor (sigma-70 family)
MRKHLAAPPQVVLEVLRSAHSSTPDPRLASVLEAFRAHWLALGHRRYPRLADDLEDVVQIALMKLVSRDKLSTLQESARLEAWGRSLFVHTVLDLLRGTERRHTLRRTYLGTPEDDPELALRDTIPVEYPTPEELASHRERLAIVAQAVTRLEIARLKFVEDIPEQEIAQRQGRTRHSVAGQLKRLRKTLRQALADAEPFEPTRRSRRLSTPTR